MLTSPTLLNIHLTRVQGIEGPLDGAVVSAALAQHAHGRSWAPHSLGLLSPSVLMIMLPNKGRIRSTRMGDPREELGRVCWVERSLRAMNHVHCGERYIGWKGE